MWRHKCPLWPHIWFKYPSRLTWCGNMGEPCHPYLCLSILCPLCLFPILVHFVLGTFVHTPILKTKQRQQNNNLSSTNLVSRTLRESDSVPLTSSHDCMSSQLSNCNFVKLSSSNFIDANMPAYSCNWFNSISTSYLRLSDTLHTLTTPAVVVPLLSAVCW